jgi:cell division control protein 6
VHNQRDDVTVPSALSLEQFIKDHQEKQSRELHGYPRPAFVKGDLEALTEKFDPPRLVHRNEELQKLAMVLLSFGGRAHTHNLFIYGRSGTGKTAAVKHATSEVIRHAQLARRLVPLYVNCRNQISHHALIAKLIEGIEEHASIPSNTSWRALCARFLTDCKNANANIVITLDEADGITRTKGDFDSLYYLSNLNSEMTDSQSTLSIIAISNDVHYGEELEERVHSRLKVEKMIFAPYTAPQLQDILQDRTDSVFTPDGLEEGIIAYSAARAAQTDGDARIAIGLVYKAAIIAAETGSGQVTMNHVLQARSALEHDIAAEAIEKLTFHEKLLLLAVARINQAHPRDPVVTMGSLLDGYGKICKQMGMEPMSPTSVARLLADIDGQGLIKTEVRSLGRARGRTTIVTLKTPLDTALRILLKEPLFHKGE